MTKLFNSFFVQFTTPEKGILDSLANLAGFTQENIAESGVIEGRGILKYEGNVWKNGSLFIGSTENEKSPNHMIKLQGPEGFTILESWSGNDDCRVLLTDCKLTKIGGILETELPLFAKQGELLKPEARALQKLLEEEGKRSTPSLKLTKEQVLLGKSGSSRSIKFTPQGSNLKIEIVFTGSIASEVLNTCLSSRNFEDALAEGVRDVFKKLPNCAFIREIEQLLVEKFRLNSIRKNRVAPVLTKTKTNSTFLSAKLQRVRTNCVAILNKLTDRVFSLETQQVILTSLIEPLAEKRLSVDGYDEFSNRIISGLKGNTTESSSASGKKRRSSSKSKTENTEEEVEETPAEVYGLDS